jgi:nitrogen fixation NifU-like protein
MKRWQCKEVRVVEFMWSSKALVHFDSPCNVGVFNDDEPSIKTIRIGSESAGEILELQIKLDEANGVILDARFRALGGVALIASASFATEHIKNLTIEQAKNIKFSEIVTALELKPSEHAAAYLVQTAILKAL